MSTYDQVHICNMALAQAGSSKQLTTLTYSGTVPHEATLCLLYWNLALEATANAHDWKCLTRRIVRADLDLTGTVTVAAGTPTAVAGTDTLFTTELIVGDRIQIGEETKIIDAITDATTLTVSEAFDEEYTDEAATRIHRATDPVSGYDVAFYLPDDFIRAKSCDGDQWTIEGQRLLTNDTSVNLVYIANVLTGLSPAFIEALVLRLSAYLALALTFDPARKERADMWLERVCLPLGRFQDSRQHSGRKISNTTWLESRN